MALALQLPVTAAVTGVECAYLAPLWGSRAWFARAPLIRAPSLREHLARAVNGVIQLSTCLAQGPGRWRRLHHRRRARRERFDHRRGHCPQHRGRGYRPPQDHGLVLRKTLPGRGDGAALHRSRRRLSLVRFLLGERSIRQRTLTRTRRTLKWRPDSSSPLLAPRSRWPVHRAARGPPT
jgi:hypothetical protein